MTNHWRREYVDKLTFQKNVIQGFAVAFFALLLIYDFF